MLQAEHAVVFIFFAWSGQAVLSQKVMAQWQTQAIHPGGQMNYSAYQLAPDNHPFTWNWIGKVIEHVENGSGSVIWLRKGSRVAFVPNAARAGIKTLESITRDCFVHGQTLSEKSVASLQNEPAPFDAGLLKILCCPETHQGLALAAASVLDNVNQRVVAGRLHNRAGQPVREKIEDGLVRTDGRYLYPMRRNIPILLVDEAIPLAG